MERSHRQRRILQLVGVVSLACLVHIWLYTTTENRGDLQHNGLTETRHGMFGYYFRPTPPLFFGSIIMPGDLPAEAQREYMARWYADHPPPPQPEGKVDIEGLTLTLLATVAIFVLFAVTAIMTRPKRIQAAVAVQGWRYA
jgi:hypothetical protein